MKLLLILITLSTATIIGSAQTLTISDKSIDSLKYEINQLKDRTEEVRRGQLNYSIEKDLLKETYNANYERLNAFITLGLGLFAILAFFGIRDINAIKRDFKSELESMKTLKSEFENKSKNFDIEKERFDNEIKKIITQNEEQNKKIKVLELKEKVQKLTEEKQNTAAYEYCTVALELAPDDLSLLTNKAILQCRLNNFSDAVDNFEKVYLMDPKNSGYAANFVESLYFINKKDKTEELITNHLDYFQQKKTNLLVLFKLIDNYFNLSEVEFKAYAESLLDFNNPDAQRKHIIGWSLTEALYFISYQPTSANKTICQNLLWYFDGSQNTKSTAEQIGINIHPNS